MDNKNKKELQMNKKFCAHLIPCSDSPDEEYQQCNHPEVVAHTTGIYATDPDEPEHPWLFYCLRGDCDGEPPCECPGYKIRD